MIAVDLDKVLLAVCQGCNEEFSEEPCEPGCCRIRAKLEKLPRVTIDDLKPKGRWRADGTCNYCGMRNPTCRSDPLADYFPVSDVVFTYLQFCPDCGADMRGGGEDG